MLVRIGASMVWRYVYTKTYLIVWYFSYSFQKANLVLKKLMEARSGEWLDTDKAFDTTDIDQKRMVIRLPEVFETSV